MSPRIRVNRRRSLFVVSLLLIETAGLLFGVYAYTRELTYRSSLREEVERSRLQLALSAKDRQRLEKDLARKRREALILRGKMVLLEERECAKDKEISRLKDLLSRLSSSEAEASARAEAYAKAVAKCTSHCEANNAQWQKAFGRCQKRVHACSLRAKACTVRELGLRRRLQKQVVKLQRLRKRILGVLAK